MLRALLWAPAMSACWAASFAPREVRAAKDGEEVSKRSRAKKSDAAACAKSLGEQTKAPEPAAPPDLISAAAPSPEPAATPTRTERVESALARWAQEHSLRKSSETSAVTPASAEASAAALAEARERVRQQDEADRVIRARLREESLERARLAAIKLERERAAASAAWLDNVEGRGNPALAPHLKDLAALRILRLLRQSVRCATLAVGANDGALTPAYEAIYRRLIQIYLERGMLIIYDADSNAAPLVRSLAGENSLGITGRAPTAESPVDNLFYIANPYIRLRAYTEDAYDLIISNDSVTSLAVLLSQSVRPDAAVSPGAPWVNPIYAWRHSTRDRGLWLPQYSGDVGRVLQEPPTMLATWSESKARWQPRKISLDHSWLEWAAGSMSLERFGEDNQRAEILVAGAQALSQDPQSRRVVPHGAVVFGSGSPVAEFDPLTYASSRYLAERGVTIATGGSGGAMEVANTAAYDAGADSLGIPLGGNFRLRSEREVLTGVQTLTFNAIDYETRIPLLLGERPLAIFAPGGKGTMKELATSLVVLAATTPQQSFHLAFLSGGFYGSLVKNLRDGLYPASIKRRIHLIDEASQMQPVVDLIDGEVGEPERFRQLVALTPRSPQNLPGDRRDRWDRRGAPSLLAEPRSPTSNLLDQLNLFEQPGRARPKPTRKDQTLDEILADMDADERIRLETHPPRSATPNDKKRETEL